jgi:hypothetical protein
MAGTDSIPVSVQLSNSLVIQVEALATGGIEKVGALDNLPFKQVTDAIEGIAASLNASLERIKPKKASVEFGLEVVLESGQLTALICKGNSKANLKITLEWSE